MKIDPRMEEAIGWMAIGYILVYIIATITPITAIVFVFIMNKYFPDVHVPGWIAVLAISLVVLDILRSLIGTTNFIAVLVLGTLYIGIALIY